MTLRRRGAAVAALSLSVGLALAGCSTPQVPATPAKARPIGASGPAAPSAGSSATGGAGSGGSCRYNRVPAGNEANVKDVGTPPASPRRTGKATMKMTTNLGAIEISLDIQGAPCAAGSFAYLAGKRFFDNTTCHRLTTEGIFVLQCGDPTATGTGGPAYQYAEENLGAPYKRGTVAIAKTQDPGTSGSQFFINYKDNLELPAQYTMLGTVTTGLEVVDKVAAAGADGGADGAPKQQLSLQQVTVTYG